MVSWQSTWYCGNKFSAVFLYQCVVRYDQRHVDWSHYFRPSYDRTKLPRLCADGAPSNYTRLVLQHLNDTFPNQWNTCSSTINQPPRSPDLTPLEFCLRSWMKSEVYRRKVGTRDELLDLIMNVIARTKGKSRCTKTSNTPCPHTSCKVHWCWRWNFRKCVVLGKLYQLCHLNNKYLY